MSKQVIGPFTVDIKVHLGNEEDRTIAGVTVGLSRGSVPTEQDIHRAIGQALAAMPEGFALLSGGDFFNKVVVKEKFGRAGNFAVPSEWNYDVEALEAAARAAYVPAAESDDEGSDDEDYDDFDDEDEDDL